MKLSWDRGTRINIQRPDPCRRVFKPDKHQLIPPRASHLCIINFHSCPFKYKFLFLMRISGHILRRHKSASRRTHRHHKQFRCTGPQLEIKSPHPLFHIHLYRNHRISITFPVKMMSGIRLIAGCHNRPPAPSARNIIKKFRKIAATGMASVVCPKPKAQNKGSPQFSGSLFEIFNCRHNVIFLIGRHLLRNIKKVFQIWFCRF